MVVGWALGAGCRHMHTVRTSLLLCARGIHPDVQYERAILYSQRHSHPASHSAFRDQAELRSQIMLDCVCSAVEKSLDLGHLVVTFSVACADLSFGLHTRTFGCSHHNQTSEEGRVDEY